MKTTMCGNFGHDESEQEKEVLLILSESYNLFYVKMYDSDSEQQSFTAEDERQLSTSREEPPDMPNLSSEKSEKSSSSVMMPPLSPIPVATKTPSITVGSKDFLFGATLGTLNLCNDIKSIFCMIYTRSIVSCLSSFCFCLIFIIQFEFLLFSNRLY